MAPRGRNLTAEECVARVEMGAEGPSALLWELDDHHVTAFTGVVDGKREVVAIEIWPAGEPRAKARADWGVAAAKRLEVLEPAAVRPLPQSARSAVPIREVLRANADIAARAEDSPSFSGIAAGRPGDWAGISSDELRRVENLADAVMYVNAVRAGRSPARAIADWRTISQRTAEGRILRARRMGLLTAANGRAVGGELTPYAEDFLRRVERVHEATERADV